MEPTFDPWTHLAFNLRMGFESQKIAMDEAFLEGRLPAEFDDHLNAMLKSYEDTVLAAELAAGLFWDGDRHQAIL